MCGTASWEWEADRFAYEPVEEYCHGCYLRAIADGAGQIPGTTINLKPTKTMEAARRAVAQEKRYQQKRHRHDDEPA